MLGVSKSRLRWGKWIGGLLLVVLFYRASCALMQNVMGGPTLLQTVRSPSGRLKAVIFSLDCGVPCDLDNSVLITSEGNEPERETGAAVFRSFSGHDDFAGEGCYPRWVRVRWLTDDDLQIVYDRRAEVDVKLPSAKIRGFLGLGARTVRVHYVPFDKVSKLEDIGRQTSGSSSRR